jgi:hypothetical protein
MSRRVFATQPVTLALWTVTPTVTAKPLRRLCCYVVTLVTVDIYIRKERGGYGCVCLRACFFTYVPLYPKNTVTRNNPVVARVLVLRWPFLTVTP